jgi:glutaredoxin
MIQVIGNPGCQRCRKVEKALDEEEIEYTYSLMTELKAADADRYMEKAKAAGQQYFPIIIKDSKLVKLEDII